MEQLTAEEKTIHQETKEAADGDTIQEEDSKQAAEEGSTQDNVSKQKEKKTEVSCVKNKLHAILQNFIFLAYMYFWNWRETSNLEALKTRRLGSCIKEVSQPLNDIICLFRKHRQIRGRFQQ